MVTPNGSLGSFGPSVPGSALVQPFQNQQQQQQHPQQISSQMTSASRAPSQLQQACGSSLSQMPHIPEITLPAYDKPTGSHEASQQDPSNDNARGMSASAVETVRRRVEQGFASIDASRQEQTFNGSEPKEEHKVHGDGVDFRRRSDEKAFQRRSDEYAREVVGVGNRPEKNQKKLGTEKSSSICKALSDPCCQDGDSDDDEESTAESEDGHTKVVPDKKSTQYCCC